MSERYEACMILATLGDIIGFNNGKYEFNDIGQFEENTNSSNFSNIIVFHFISQNGFTDFPTPNMTWSDDTIYHLTIADALISKCKKDKKDILDKITENFIKTIDTPEKIRIMTNKYAIGSQTITSLKSLLKGEKWENFIYSPSAGGSGGSMRSMCIGLAYHGINNRMKLIEMSIDSCRITHNNAIAYLGSLTSALFTALAIENVDPTSWVFELKDLLMSNVIDNYIKDIYPDDFDKYHSDKLIFLHKWLMYIEFRFNKYKFIEKPSMTIPSFRSRIYHERFSSKKNTIYPGAGGDDSVIIAYDALLDAGDSWEKLVVYSMLHVGDSDTTGTIAAGWYGAYYGMDKVNKNMLKNFKEYKKFGKIGEELYECYN